MRGSLKISPCKILKIRAIEAKSLPAFWAFTYFYCTFLMRVRKYIFENMWKLKNVSGTRNLKQVSIVMTILWGILLIIKNCLIFYIRLSHLFKLLSLQSFMLKQALKLSKNFINFLLKKTILKNFKSWIHRCKL